MTNERLKELMEQVGHPNSHSIMQLILQVENETEQRIKKQCNLQDDYDARAHQAAYP